MSEIPCSDATPGADHTAGLAEIAGGQRNFDHPRSGATVDALDLVEESVAVLDLDLYVKAWNAGAERLYGWRRDEVMGGRIQTFVRCAPTEPLAVILAKIRAAGTWRGEFTRTTKNGTTVVVRANWTLRNDSDGAALDIVETSRDITEVRRTEEAFTRIQATHERSERRYRDVFHFLPVALLQLDAREAVEVLKELRANGVEDLSDHLKQHPQVLTRLLEGLKIVEVNRRTVEMFRARSPEEFSGSVARYWTEFSDPVREAMAARYSGKNGFEALVKIRAHDGTMLDALFFAAFGPVTGEQHVSLCGFIDVSERVKAQEMLSRVQAEIAHAARVSILGELTASIAHEVGQPLTAIEANTQAILLWIEQFPPNIKEIRDLGASTAIQVQRAADIIHRIRSMVVGIDPVYEHIDVNPVIQDSLLFLRSELHRNRIETSLRFGDNLPRILADRVQLQQVIVNLSLNAIQSMASTDGTPRELGITSAATSDGSVLIEVDDSGTGIEDDAVGRLFESFFTTKSSGMGIGLRICRSIIDAHGGRLFAANRTDRDSGARFSIVLPAARADLTTPLYRVVQPLV
jgi:PAS domain S-box-containing protein